MRAVKVVCCVIAFGCSREARDTAAANIPADESCDFVRVVAHEAPLPLIYEFVTRDARGEFTQASAWFNAAVDCPGHEPGPDQATIAVAHSVRITTQSRDSVVAEVRWQRVGYVTGGVSRAAPGAEVDTLLAIRTPYGWRIASPALNPHVPGPAASRPDV